MIALQGIVKKFGGVPVLRGVSFAVGPGRTLGLAGENGAGKSTLMNIVGGNVRADAGSMTFQGRPYRPANPLEAARTGISFIHQELNLFPNLSIAENIFLTDFPKRGGVLVDHSALTERTRALLGKVGLNVPPTTPVERLSAGEQQLVEVAKALRQEARLIIFDEPTTSLSARESDHLFSLIGRLRERGVAMIYISHALGDLLRLADDVVVLRDGAVVGNGQKESFCTERIISLMVGRSLDQIYPTRKGQVSERVALEVEHLTRRGVVRDVSFRLRAGEILGVSGLMGAGRSELARILFGLDLFDSGRVAAGGQQLERVPPRERIRRGLAFLTENRREEGLCMDAGIGSNISLVALAQHRKGPLGLLDRVALGERVRAVREAVRLTATSSNTQPVRTLSGGNQQKVVLAKWLLAKPAVLILDEPTRGIDVGARFEIYQLILQLADQGAAVLMLSSDLEELVGLSDRILVMHRGKIRDELVRGQFDRERIMRAAVGNGSAEV